MPEDDFESTTEIRLPGGLVAAELTFCDTFTSCVFKAHDGESPTAVKEEVSIEGKSSLHHDRTE